MKKNIFGTIIVLMILGVSTTATAWAYEEDPEHPGDFEQEYLKRGKFKKDTSNTNDTSTQSNGSQSSGDESKVGLSKDCGNCVNDGRGNPKVIPFQGLKMIPVKNDDNKQIPPTKGTQSPIN